MKVFFYEFLKRITEKKVIIFTIASTAILITLVYSSYSYSSPPSEPHTGYDFTGALFNRSGSYYFDSYLFNNGNGSPVSNIGVSITLNNKITQSCVEYSHSTNSEGFSNVSISNVSDPLNCCIIANINENNANGTSSLKPGGIHIPATAAIPYGQSAIQICQFSLQSKLAPSCILAVSFNATGHQSGNLMVYYNYSCSTGGNIQLEKSDILGEEFTNFSVIKFSPKISQQYYYTNIIFIANGEQTFPSFDYTALFSPAGDLERAYTNIYYEVAFIMGILGLSLAYISYNKDRLSGSYQELMVRPNTRTGLMTSRFFAVSFLLILVSSMAGLATYLLGIMIFSFYSPLTFILYIIFSSFILSDAIAAISFLFGTRIRSPAGIVALPIILFFLLLVIVPAIVPEILSLFGLYGGIGGSETYNLIILLVSFFNPTSSFSIIGSSLYRPIMKVSSLYVPGVVIWISVMYCVLWIIIPYIGNYFLSKNSD